MPILTTQQTLTVGDVTNIVVTPLVRDEDTGLFVREFRIFTIDAERISPLDPALPPPETIGDHAATDQRQPRRPSHRRATLGVLRENRHDRSDLWH